MLDLKEEFNAFRDECVDLAILINTFDRLFGDAQAKSALGRIAPQFSNDLNRWMIELYILKSYRLLDREVGFGRKNLSAKYLGSRLEDAKLLTSEIQRLLSKLDEYRQLIHAARNRLVAHADLEQIVLKVGLGEHSEKQALDFRKNLQDFCDAVGRAIGVGPTEFINISPGDVSDLLHHLKYSTRHSG
ncbi:hypothetical protein [Roseovarius atlanticus]|uniref:AbiU2 domain-containing protein n=1 Tax=Roseovarius atlanticus TaxID=1641875 RepID=UPI001C94F4C4|nr:hypothetical protein [Roseovarius atlanticus]MBY5986675.1 hypothetical protein [Roseovarius atlanticus]MBY6125315.1 hypothetical protein [Roseovarius atlanticus]MBY6150224.1 hypothetical protein [Roseovarius atlanticus]